MFNPVAPYRYLLHTVYLFVADIANPDLLACSCRRQEGSKQFAQRFASPL